MPQRDGTGPAGKGPMTGRGAGYCWARDLKQRGPQNAPGKKNPGISRNMGQNVQSHQPNQSPPQGWRYI
jgi:hypothetical protein